MCYDAGDETVDRRPACGAFSLLWRMPALMQSLHAGLKAGDLTRAEAIADKVLALIAGG